jgi:nascent polypeptide-associated complex subunit alpha
MSLDGLNHLMRRLKTLITQLSDGVLNMMPGIGKVNPRQMKQAMRKMGITTEEIENVEEVVIRTPSVEYVIKNASVSVMGVQGQKTYQVMGDAVTRPRAQACESQEEEMPPEDVELVMSQTGCDSATARQALKECGGQPAEAIIKVMTS